jgi:hypothetical protein
MMFTTIQDSTLNLWKTGRKTRTSSGGWLSGNAVCCVHNGETVDKRGRGGVITNADGGVSYSCFNCNFRASYVPGRHLTYKFRKLLKWMGADENTIRHLAIEAMRVREVITPEQVTEPEEEVTFTPHPLPKEALSFEQLATFYLMSDSEVDPEEFEIPYDPSEAMQYVIDRKVFTGVGKGYEFYWTPETAYNLNQRVIIPFYWKGEIVGYTARAVNDNVKPKYHSSYDHHFVFNVDKQLPTSKFVIVCEGPFDAMSIDGVAVLTNRCYEKQADIIESLGKEVIVVPDTGKAGAKLVDDAMEYGWSVSFPSWQKDYNDINKAVQHLGKLFVLKSILAAKETYKLKIEYLKRKLYGS